jgi:hypothetical protein
MFGIMLFACSNGERDSRLILGPGYAWVDSFPVGERDGYIFNADGTFNNIDDYSSTDGILAIYATGTWSTSRNNRLVMNLVGETTRSPYTVTETTLILNNDWVFTKTAVTLP